MSAPRAVIFGGGGYFGRLLVRELLRRGGCEVVVAGRRRAPTPPGAGFIEADMLDAASAGKALELASVAVCAAGPFQGLPETLPRLCLERGVHYLDLADDRDHVARVRAALAERAALGPVPAIGAAWSSSSALTGLLARLAAAGLDRVHYVYAHMAPGNRSPRGPATVLALLSSLGRELRLRGVGGTRTATGWSEPRGFPFPPPIGPRTGRLVDAPDHDLLPELFSGAAAEFRVSAELGILNAFAAALARLAAAGLIRPAAWASTLTRALALMGGLGHDWGAVGVELRGEKGGRPATRRASLVAEAEGPLLAVLPAAVLVPRLALGRVAGGWLRHDDWLDRAGLEAECGQNGWRLVFEDGGDE